MSIRIKKASHTSKPKAKGSKKSDSVSKGHGKSKRVSLTSIKRKISGVKTKVTQKIENAKQRIRRGVKSFLKGEHHVWARIGLRVHLKIGKWFYKRFSRHRT